MVALNPAERKLLGSWFLRSLAGIATSTLIYGISISLFLLSTYTFTRPRPKALRSWALFSTTIITFLLATVLWAANLAFFASYIQKAFFDGAFVPIGSGTPRVMSQSVLGFKQILLASGSQMLTDAVVVWRAWVICVGHRQLMILPLSLFLGMCALCFAFLALTSDIAGYNTYLAGGNVHALHQAAAGLSLSTNAVTYRRFWKFGRGGYKSHAQAVLLMIVESGAFYTALQLATAITFDKQFIDYASPDYFSSLYLVAYIESTAMYPTIVLLLIEQKRSVEQVHYFVSTSIRDALNGEENAKGPECSASGPERPN
ncbi:hypothetical protein FPV67DRAFT_1782710 [Lyophyllum atratum]|nr:hypothetical protein FPV67DRAFT_1782710 [Lyophyllum atratum]